MEKIWINEILNINFNIYEFYMFIKNYKLINYNNIFSIINI
jgi:hypothetical protein